MHQNLSEIHVSIKPMLRKKYRIVGSCWLKIITCFPWKKVAFQILDMLVGVDILQRSCVEQPAHPYVFSLISILAVISFVYLILKESYYRIKKWSLHFTQRCSIMEMSILLKAYASNFVFMEKSNCIYNRQIEQNVCLGEIIGHINLVYIWSFIEFAAIAFYLSYNLSISENSVSPYIVNKSRERWRTLEWHFHCGKIVIRGTG